MTKLRHSDIDLPSYTVHLYTLTPGSMIFPPALCMHKTKGINDTAIHWKTKVQLLPTKGVSKKFMEEVVLFPSIFCYTFQLPRKDAS